MTPAEFKRKWHRYQGKETSAYQGHFDDLCRLLGQPTPAEADPTGSESFCFQKRVVKDAELFELHEGTGEEAEPSERGFADVWKKGCFAWEYKGKRKNLDDAYKQLLRYRESLLNPPLLVVCDFDRYVVRTNFNGTVQEVHEFTNDQVDRPEHLKILRAVFSDPDYLKPQRTTEQVTKDLAATIAEVARSLQSRESVELSDATTRAEVTVAQKKNLRIARFLNRIIFCFFAEDTGLLPKRIFSDICKAGLDDTKLFAESLEQLFRVMAKGGVFGHQKIRHFNGHLFEESTVFELTETEVRKLADASEADWQFIQPSIMGTLFQRALDERQRAALGAQYTGETDIRDLVEPVLMAPLRREWAALKDELVSLVGTSRRDVRSAQRADPTMGKARERLAAFLKKLRTIIVLDPACGSGNFLYVSLQMLLDLEKEVIAFAVQLGFRFEPEVSVQQLRAIEINPYAFELAQVSVQIGFLQWRRDNGFDNDRSPVLQNLDGFQNEDALLVPHFRSKAKTLKEAQAGEHQGDDALKFYTEREWPKCDVIVSNPPFLGDKLMRGELGDGYVEELRRIYGNRIPGQSDLCCYWFEKAREQIESNKCNRAGLLATQGIRGGANREVLKRIKDTGDIFFAVSDREWILDGAMVHVSMVGFDGKSEAARMLDGHTVQQIHENLTAHTNITKALSLAQNSGLCFIGAAIHGPFVLDPDVALEHLKSPNTKGCPNSNVIRPWANALTITKGETDLWIVDVPPHLKMEEAAFYEAPFKFLSEVVLPVRRKNRRAMRAKNWWILGDPQKAMRAALTGLIRYFISPRVSKHRLFVWVSPELLATDATVAFASASDYIFGLMSSRIHEVWALAQGTQLREKESGFRYTPSTCVETFPFPRPTPAQEAAIAAAAKELNELRERWLNPPEWTRTEYLEFPASVNGPWSRYIDQSTIHEVGRVTPCAPSEDRPDASVGKQRRAEDCPPYRVGTVRYPRLEPRDAECAAKLKRRTLTNLYNERPAWLDLAHKKLDAAVAAAYGFPADLTDEQILERLLVLNRERAAEEEKAAKVKKPKTSRAKRGDEMI